MKMSPERTIRLDLEYDGTDFVGWQIQPRGRSVQGEIARALQLFLQDHVVPVGSGRTDAGTHARGQVAHFHTRSRHCAERIKRALNSLLPPDIVVTAASDAEAGFHARKTALSKVYRYRIATAKCAVERRQVWQVHRALDVDAMRQGAKALLGTHEFDAFCNHHPRPPSFTCRVLNCAWREQKRELTFDIEADRFLRHMVRIIVGTLVEVGSGRRPREDMARLLHQPAPAQPQHSEGGGGPDDPRSGASAAAPVRLPPPGDCACFASTTAPRYVRRCGRPGPEPVSHTFIIIICLCHSSSPLHRAQGCSRD